MNASNYTLPKNFIPWGLDQIVECTEPNGLSTECADLALPGQNPGGLSTCVKFTGGLPEGVDVESGKAYCVCNIAYGRSGNDCEDADYPGWGYMVLPNSLLCIGTCLWILYVVFKAQRKGLLVPSAATTTTLVTLFCSVIVQIWVNVRLALYLGAPEAAYRINLIAAAICAGGIVVNMLVVTLVFQAVKKSASKMKKGSSGDGIGKKEKTFVVGSSAFVMVSILALVFSGKNSIASMAAAGYILFCFILYMKAANQMKQLLKEASAATTSGSSNVKAQKAFERILKVIRQIIFFVCVFLPSALMYTITTTDKKSSRLSPHPAAAIGLTMMHFIGSFAILWIGQFCAGPLLSKVGAKGGASSAVSAASSASTSG